MSHVEVKLYVDRLEILPEHLSTLDSETLATAINATRVLLVLLDREQAHKDYQQIENDSATD